MIQKCNRSSTLPPRHGTNTSMRRYRRRISMNQQALHNLSHFAIYRIALLCYCFIQPLQFGVTAQSVQNWLALGDQAIESDVQLAIQYYKKGIDTLSDNDSLSIRLGLYTNLATAYSVSGHDKQALPYYEQALQIYTTATSKSTDNTDATSIAAQTAFFLGQVYQDLEQYRDAVDAYTMAYELDPLHWSAVANLGAVYQDYLQRHTAAIHAYTLAYNIVSNHGATDPPPEPQYIQSQLQYRIGLCYTHQESIKDCKDDPDYCRQHAAHAFALSLDFDPEHEAARHWLATVTADVTMERASNTYVQSLFDEYATNFEHSLVEELKYDGFARLRRGFNKAMRLENKEHHVFDKVIDAGCGTGLVGEQFRNISNYLIGVDLSEAIIQQAEQVRPNLYNQTMVDDVIAVFYDARPISLIVAADSYIYFGDWSLVMEAMQNGLSTDNGYAAFTLENVDAQDETILRETKPDWRWQLTASGRFAHNREYVELVGRVHNLQTIYYEALEGFRYEKGVGVRGHLFVMKRMREQQYDDEL